MNVNQPNNLTLTPLFNGGGIHTEPQTVRGYYRGTAAEPMRFDLTYLADTQNFTGVQCIYLDNSENDGAAIIEVEETNQRIKCPAGKQGYFPLLVPGRAKFTLRHDGTGTANIPVFFLNFNIAQGVW